MKTSIVPAQITSIEDTITAKLSLTQIILLVLPVFVASIVFAGLPPMMHIKVYKLGITLFVAIPIALLAIRFRGQLLLYWLGVLASYHIRPRRYVATISPSCSDDSSDAELTNAEPETMPTLIESQPISDLTASDYLVLEDFLSNKRVTYFTDNKGQLNARIKAQ